MQPANPAVNAAANPATNDAANAAANPPANVAANAAGNIADNAANAASAQANTAANLGENAGAQPPPVQANRVEGSQRRSIRDEVEIARRANYDCDHGVPNALDANNPVQETELRNMHDQELLRRAQYDQDNGPPDDLYIVPTAYAQSASPEAVQLPSVFTASPDDQIPQRLQASHREIRWSLRPKYMAQDVQHRSTRL
jgi:hypothetical protein